MINFKLSPLRVVDPAEDDLSRHRVGYAEGQSNEQTCAINRGLWVLGERAARQHLATFSFEDTVVAAMTIDRIETIPSKDPLRRPKQAIVGRVLTPKDAEYADLLRTPPPTGRNPVGYVEDSDYAFDGRCLCGCDQQVTSGRYFAAGHDQKAVRDRIKSQWGDTVEFLRWFDSTYGPMSSRQDLVAGRPKID